MIFKTSPSLQDTSWFCLLPCLAKARAATLHTKGTWGGGFRGDSWLTDTPVSKAQPTDSPGCVHAHGVPASLQRCE